MKDWITWVLAALLGLCFYQNMVLSKKIAVIYKQNLSIKTVLEEGICD